MTATRGDTDWRGDTVTTATEASLGDLLSRVTEDVNQLVRSHVELAKIEIKEEATRASKGAGMLTGAAVAAYLTLLLLSFAAAWGLAEVMEPGFAFLIVGAVWAIAAAVLASIGRKKLRQAHAVPPKTKTEIQEDVTWARQQTS